MPRSDVIRADLDRVQNMTDDEFAVKWGAWAASQDRDPALVRQRWVADLQRALPFAEREDAAVVELVAAKDAYRADPNPATRDRKELAANAVQSIRVEERGSKVRLAGDAFVMEG